MNMRQPSNVVRLTLLVAALCAACAYHAPTAPTPPPLDSSAPQFLTLGAVVGTGARAGWVTVTATVQNGHGATLEGVVVVFTTDLGTVAPVACPTGVSGKASTTLGADDSATVIATVGTLRTQLLIPHAS